MAVDTQTKRRSVQGYGAGWLAPVPDGTVEAADRKHLSSLYAAVLAVEVLTPIITYTPGVRRWTYTPGVRRWTYPVA